MRDDGMTHQQIANELSRQLGTEIKRSTVSAEFYRKGKTNAAKKYPREIPWTVQERHQTHYAARMLRLLGRRNAGILNSDEASRRLDSWLGQLEDEGAVVTYVPDTPDGFYYTPGTPANGIPIVVSIDD